VYPLIWSMGMIPKHETECVFSDLEHGHDP
jgi:hypothetical protein